LTIVLTFSLFSLGYLRPWGAAPLPRKPLKSKSTFAFGKSKPYGLPTFFVGARLDLNFQSEKLTLFRDDNRQTPFNSGEANRKVFAPLFSKSG
jgi:hypothetical protein